MGDGLLRGLRQLPGFLRGLMLDRRWRRELMTARPFALDELPEGTRGRVTGVVHPSGPVLSAPLSGRACVFYTVTVEELGVVSLDGHTGPVHEVGREQQVVTFLLDDGRRRAVIDPTHARIWAWCDHETTGERRDVLERLSPTNNPYRTVNLLYREAIIEVGTTIVVVGSGMREVDPHGVPIGIYRDGHSTRMRLRGSARLPLLISYRTFQQ